MGYSSYGMTPGSTPKSTKCTVRNFQPPFDVIPPPPTTTTTITTLFESRRRRSTINSKVSKFRQGLLIY